MTALSGAAVPPALTSCPSARWTPSDQFAGGACCGAVTAAANCDRKKSWTTKQHDGGAKQKKQPPYFTPLPPPSSSWIFLHPPTTFSYAQPVRYSLKSPGCDISSRSALFLTCHVHPLQSLQQVPDTLPRVSNRHFQYSLDHATWRPELREGRGCYQGL